MNNGKTKEILVYCPNGEGDRVIKNEDQLMYELRKCKYYSCHKSYRSKISDSKLENSYTEEEIKDYVEEFIERKFNYIKSSYNNLNT